MYTRMVTYHKACLNCLKADTAKFSYLLRTEDERVSPRSKSKKSEEFYLSQDIKVDLWNQKDECLFCGHKGAYDIWDIEVDGEKAYTSLDSSTDHVQIYLQRLPEGGSRLQFRPYADVSVGQFLSFFGSARMVVENTPNSVFIPKEKGFVDIIVFFDHERFNADINRFRHAGFSKDEVISAIDQFEERFKANHGLA